MSIEVHPGGMVLDVITDESGNLLTDESGNLMGSPGRVFAVTIYIGGGGTVAGWQDDTPYNLLSLTAVPAPGYQLGTWIVRGQQAGRDNVLSLAVTEDILMAVVFIPAVIHYPLDSWNRGAS